ncbi:glycerophosphocholine acyltransferase KNAG_0C03000 [Huiozyma naganishii CBS 8797]|uniref:Glycerophosphocholine acyltransferase 1 n=1 Tax=Huiozyma naganishii (strain ATCC MYA-139 / BCRC 22969 / CBS 8797 / KCTC 17520 / NBRC 10181 / NCYC 3082 / Yp74L-3) TaxID=1071383 RepID=J7S5W9_HUIN7|nr:hypothetical protein KNAG_0C03000 [Kazachstania naganishii CBS 8797]CCK69411.1 hypothetical protein KNAG_0C03000 [Kazachstania naganishii CBS 8797]
MMFDVDPELDTEDTRISLASILELLDPIASKVSSRKYPLRGLYYNRGRQVNDSAKHLSHRTKQNYHHLRNRLSDTTSNRLRSIDEIKNKLLLRVKGLDEPLHTIFFKDINKLEKLFYPFTLFNIFSIGMIMGQFPEWFHVYYTFLLGLLMPIRFYTYYKTQTHYFMADLCYFVNFLCLVYIWVWPQSRSLFLSCFCLTFGSLSFAVITWRNSLVLHSIDKTTSCFIHIIPPVAMYVIYYGLPAEYQKERFPAAIKSSVNLKSNIVWTSLYYLLWQSMYHYFITLKKSSKIKSGERMTSFEYLTSHQFKDFWAVNLKAPWPMVIYITLQYLYQLCTMLLCSLWLRSRIAAAAFLSSIFLIAAHNGATYYVDYYGRSFEKQVNKLKAELEELQKQLYAKDNELEVLSDSDMSFSDSTVSATPDDRLSGQ